MTTWPAEAHSLIEVLDQRQQLCLTVGVVGPTVVVNDPQRELVHVWLFQVPGHSQAVETLQHWPPQVLQFQQVRFKAEAFRV